MSVWLHRGSGEVGPRPGTRSALPSWSVGASGHFPSWTVNRRGEGWGARGSRRRREWALGFHSEAHEPNVTLRWEEEIESKALKG